MPATRSTYPLSARLALALVVLVVTLGLAELALRLTASLLPAARLPLHYDTAALDEVVAGEAYVSFDQRVGWLPTPGVDRKVGNTHYRHNRDGLRSDRVYATEPPARVRRFAAYGDSFTYCQEVSIGNCWTSRLEELLPDAEVPNYGIPGAAPDQAWLRYQRVADSDHPCAVLIGYMVENINRIVNRFRPFYEPKTGLVLAKPRFILDHGTLQLLPVPAERPDLFADPIWVEENLGPGDAWYFPGLFVANPFDRLMLVSLARTARYQSERHEGVEWTRAWAARTYRPDSEALQLAVALLSAFADEVRANGATPVVLVFPLQGEVAAERDGQPRTHAPLLAALEERGIATLDLTEVLGREARRTDMSKLFDGHLTPTANQLVARTLADRLPNLTSATCGG